MKLKWINVLHLYQPPTQAKEVVDRVVSESYRKILSLLERYPDLKLTLNIAGSLIELLEKHGHADVIAGFRRHAERGAVELLGSAMYHPILPLLPESEIRRQIALHDEISRRAFGAAYAPRGFYFPEMAYSAEAAHVIAECGFSFVVLDEVHAGVPVSPENLYRIQDIGVGVIFRNTAFSKSFPPESVVKSLSEIPTAHLITCHDGELYGHWHSDDRGYYEKAFANPEIATLTASEYLREISSLPENAAPHDIAVRAASWESTHEELEKNIAHGLWNDPLNAIHQELELFKQKTLSLIEERREDPGYAEARGHADRGVASCAWWWASERKIGPFSPKSWNPTEIEKGAVELFSAVQSLQSLSASEKQEWEKQFKAILDLVWSRHRKDHDPSFER